MSEATSISTGDKPVLRFERFLPRPIEQVWRAVTDPQEMRAWCPTRIAIDRWEPGATHTHHLDDPSVGPLPGVVLECSAPHRLVFTWGEDTIGASSSGPLTAGRPSCSPRSSGRPRRRGNRRVGGLPRAAGHRRGR